MMDMGLSFVSSTSRIRSCSASMALRTASHTLEQQCDGSNLRQQKFVRFADDDDEPFMLQLVYNRPDYGITQQHIVGLKGVPGCAKRRYGALGKYRT